MPGLLYKPDGRTDAILAKLTGEEMGQANDYGIMTGCIYRKEVK